MFGLLLGLICLMFANFLLGTNLATLKKEYDKDKMVSGIIKIGGVVLGIVFMLGSAYLTKDIIFNSIKGRKRSCNSKEIDIYDLFGNFIDTVKNARVAENKYGIPFRNVSQVCNGLKRQSHGYICRFHGDDFDKYEILRKDGKQCALR